MKRKEKRIVPSIILGVARLIIIVELDMLTEKISKMEEQLAEQERKIKTLTSCT